MKIGIYIADIQAELGGGARFQDQVIGGLLDLNTERHQFCLIGHSTSTPFGEPGIVVEANDSPSRTQRLLQRTGLASSNDDAVSSVLQEHQIDVIYSPHPVALTHQLPYIVTCWDLQHRMQPFFPEVSTTGWDWESRERHYRTVLRRAAAVITGTEQGKQEVTQFYGVAHQRVTVIPFAVPDRLVSATAVEPDWPVPDEFIVYPAQFWPHKNHISILLALKQLRDADQINLAAVFPGASQPHNACTMQYVQEVAQAQNIPVHFPGFVSDGELKWLYQHSRALVFASLFGPDNLPPLEAMSVGCPVIASRVCGSEEQYGDAAMLVPAADEIAIAKALRVVLRDSEVRDGMIKRGQELANSLTQLAYTRGLLDLFDGFARLRRCWK